MMMRRFFLPILLLFSLYSYTNAQKLYISDAEDINLRNDDFAVVGKMNQKIVCYRKRNNLPEIIIYNAQMIKEKAVPAEFIPENHTQLYFSSNGKRVVVFYQVREQKSEKLYAATLDEERYQWQSPQLLYSLSTSQREKIVFRKISSTGRSHHLLYAAYREDGHQHAIALAVEHTTLQHRDYSITLQDKELTISDFGVIHNDGKAMLLAHDYPSTKGTMDELQCIYLKNSGEVIQEKINLDKHIVSEIKVKADEQAETFYIAGLFAEGRYNQPKGLFFIHKNIDAGKESSSHFLPLSIHGSGKMDQSTVQMKVRNVYLRKDGGIELVAEKFSQNTRTIQSLQPVMTMGMMTTFNDNSRTIQEYYYDEVVVFNMSRDGSLDWSQVILKEQMSTDDNGIFSSFAVMQHSMGKVYLFNEMQQRSDRLMAGYLNYKGDFSIKEIQKAEHIDDWSLMPRSALQVSATEIIMPCLSKNQLSFLKIAF